MERPVKKVLRSPMPKKRSKIVPLSERVTLERVLGVTVKDNSAFTCDPNTGLIAYPAGCVIVIFNPRNNKQYHIFNQSKKTITALSFSSDGKNLVSGECGHNPAVRVWDVEERSQVAELQGHKFGVACVAFSPNLRYVVSIGEQHDMAVNVWNWKEGAKVCSGKISNKVTGLCFSEDGGMFVTVGNRNVKFWYLSAKRKTRETLPLNGRSGILGEQRNNFFCSVACGKGKNSNKTYCITKSGLLCEFNDSRLLDKWVELRTNVIWTDCREFHIQKTLSAFCLTASEDHLFVGCADGVLRVFDSSTLHFVSTFPKPHFLGVNVSEGIDPSHMGTHQNNARYPDTIALVLDDVNKKVTCIYNDHSVYVWDVHDLKKIGKHRSFLYHSSCIWGVEMYPKMLDSIREMLPSESFITCSSDDTIRIWNTDPAMTSDVFKRNIYSKELLKILYIDENHENLLDVDYNPAGTSDKTDPGEGKNGVRCLCVSPDGQYLASGDRSGNVRVHDLQFMDELYCIEAHDSEVLCLEFTKPETGFNLLASASRDRLIHIFNMDENCSLLQTLDDHSSCITAVKFSYSNDQLQMISCGADKALMFRTAVQTPDFQFVRNHHVVGKQTLYDITIDPTKKFVATACQDRNLRIHNTATGKLKRIYKGSLSDDGTLIKVELDPSGMYIATSCSDKTLAIFDFYSGECVATMTGHSELVTGIKFSNDCKHLISASGDGCIFLWQLPWGITHNMKERLAEMGQVKRRQQQYDIVRRGTYDIARRGTYVVPKDMPLRMRTQIQAASQSTRNNNNNTEGQAEEGIEDGDFTSAAEQLQALETQAKRESIVPDDYRFSMGQLPLWAKKQVSGENIPSPSTYSSPSQPKGRWAQRIDGKGIKVKSEWENTIEVRLEDCLDRRRYTVEPDALLDQVMELQIQHELENGKDFPVSEEEFQDSVDAEFISAEEGLKTFERELSQEEMQRLATSFVTSTRGSDPFLPPAHDLSDPKSTSPLTSQEDSQETSQDDEEEEEEEVVEDESSSAKEDDSKEEDIIYPPSEETPSSPESYEITASTKSLEEFVKRKKSFKEKSFREKSFRAKSETGSTDSMSSEKKTTDESSEATSQDQEITDPTSISTDEEEEIEDDSLEEEEEEDSLPSTTDSKADNAETTTDDEAFLHTNFNFLDFMEKEKFGKCLEQLQSGFTDDIATGRLSISSKFLSRSQLSQPRGPVVGVHGLSAATGGISAEQYLLRRKQEMAMAVDKTRRRLQMLGWKVSDSGKKLVSASSLDSLSKPQENQKSLTPVNKVKPQVRSQTSSPVNKVGSCSDLSRSSTSSKDSDDKELDRADSLEDMLDPKSSQTLTKSGSSPDVSSTSHSPVTSKSSSGRTPPAVAPKPRKRTKNATTVVESKVASSSSGDEVSTRSEDSLISKEDPKPKSSSPESLSFASSTTRSSPDTKASSTTRSSPDTETVVAKPRKKELPQVPLKATGLEVSPQRLEEIKMEQEDSVFADNKENSRYSPAEARRGSCGASKAKINKMKNKKDRETAMRRAASLSDIGTEDDKNSPSHTMQLRSRSSERPAAAIRSVPNSPAREKRRATKTDRIVPLLSNQQQKLRSYEIGTKSSRAKVHPKPDTPPVSPNRYKKKRSLLNELKDIKNKQDSDKVTTITTNDKNKEIIESSVPTGVVKPVEINNPTIEIKSDPASHVSMDSLETEDKTKVLELKSPDSDTIEIKSFNSDTIELKSDKSDVIELLSVKSDSSETKSDRSSSKSSDSTSNKSGTTQKDSKSQKSGTTQNLDTKFQKSDSKSQKSDDSSISKEEADRLLMPPPVSIKVPRTRTGQKTEPKQVTKKEVEGKKTSANKCVKSTEHLSVSEKSGSKSTEHSSESDQSGTDLSPREEDKELSLSDISPISDVSYSPPSLNGHDIALNGQDDSKNGHDDGVINGHTEDMSENTVSVTGNDADGEQTVSVGSRGSPLSSTCDSIPDDILTESATELSESANIPTIEEKPIEAVRRKMSLDLPTAPKEPTPSADVVTPDELKTGVNDMRKAFENCMSLFNKATSPDTPDITKSHQMLDYLSSTLNSMQVSVAKLQSQRRRFYNSTSEESILSACNTCSSQLQERSRASSMGFLASARKPSSSLSHTDLSELKVTLAKTKSPGNGKSRESDAEAASAIVLLDRYSEMLVSMVRDKIVEESMITPSSKSSSGSSYATDV